MQIPPELLVGPAAAVLVLLWVARELWKAHRESDADVKQQRDDLADRLEQVIGLAEKGSKDIPK